MARGARKPGAKSTDRPLAEDRRPLWLKRRTHLARLRSAEPIEGETQDEERPAAEVLGGQKESAVTKLPQTNKTDFVRNFPKASPKEVIAKAHAEGIQIDLDYLYKVRSSDRLGKLKTKAETRPASPRMGVSVPRPTATASSAEDVL